MTLSILSSIFWLIIIFTFIQIWGNLTYDFSFYLKRGNPSEASAEHAAGLHGVTEKNKTNLITIDFFWLRNSYLAMTSNIPGRKEDLIRTEIQDLKLDE